LPESRECLGKIQIFLAQNPTILPQNPIFFTCKPIFLNGFMSFLKGFPSFFDGFPTFAFGFLLSATPFYFPRCLSAFCKGFLIFLNGFPIFLDGFPLSEKSEKIYLQQQVYERLLFELRNSLPLRSPSFAIATCSPTVIIEINTESEYQQPADWNGVINQVKNYGM
jgi:hypothetical protein